MNPKAWELIGRAIKDYYLGAKNATLITDSDCAGREEMPAAVFFRTARQWPDVERYAVSVCRGRTLDVGAGAGCHSLFLQRKGVSVTALDISPDAVFTMFERGVSRAVCMDVHEFCSGYEGIPFDTVLMMMNGIGVVGHLAGLELFLKEIRPLLAPGGQLLFDSADLRDVKDGEPGSRRLGHDPSRYYGIVNYEVEYQGQRSEPFQWLYLDQRTLRKYAAAAGWDCQIIYEEGAQYLARLFSI